MKIYPTELGEYEDGFWSRVHIPPDVSKCWLWTGGTCSNYGVARLWNKLDYYTHRLVYTVIHGKVPKGMMVLHRCNNKLCVNPAHLYPGDARDNANDYWRARFARESTT